MKCIISCEHASNYIPSGFRHLFRGSDKVLTSDQAYDPGAAELALRLAEELQVSAHLGTISRLLIDLNRSPSNRKSLYTVYSRKLAPDDRELFLQKYYQPYRDKVERLVAGQIVRGMPILHLSVHSFTPVKNGKVRRADIGLLYDPAHPVEKNICAFLATLLQQKVKSLQVRKNYPYLGKTDGFASFLRRKYPAKLYAGIEIELNQALLVSGETTYRQMTGVLVEGIRCMVRQDDFSTIAAIRTAGRKADGYLCR
jgi:predicted N-formylglutamate amidohydrolase